MISTSVTRTGGCSYWIGNPDASMGLGSQYIDVEYVSGGAIPRNSGEQVAELGRNASWQDVVLWVQLPSGVVRIAPFLPYVQRDRRAIAIAVFQAAEGRFP